MHLKLDFQKSQNNIKKKRKKTVFICAFFYDLCISRALEKRIFNLL